MTAQELVDAMFNDEQTQKATHAATEWSLITGDDLRPFLRWNDKLGRVVFEPPPYLCTCGEGER